MLARHIEGHEIRTVQQMGWTSVQNGEPLRLAVAAGFEALVTGDRNFEYQQHIPRSGIGVIVLRARSNKREDILPLAPLVVAALETLVPGQIVHVGGSRTFEDESAN